MRKLPDAVGFGPMLVAATACTSIGSNDVDLRFRAMEYRIVNATHIWESDEDSFVADLPDRNVPRCYDLYASDDGVRTQLATLAALWQDRDPPTSATLTLTFDAVATVPADRATLRMVDDDLVVSSSAWYFTDGKQVFLDCPESSSDWKVFRVSDVKVL